jgi:hypothetical protein
MKMSRSLVLAAAIAAIPALSSVALRADQLDIYQFGDGGWRSDDTRNTSGTNLVGITSTNAPAPGSTPSAADDLAIAQQIQFVGGPAGSTYGGAVSIDGTSSNSGKSNISTIDAAGITPATSLLSNSFSATYEWYGQPNATSRTLAFKIGIQSTSYGTGAGQSQNGFNALRSGESVWDLVLVHTGAGSDNVWSTESVDHDTGGWNLFRQAGNAFFPVPTANPDPNAPTMTLDDWANDSTFGPLLFGTGAKVSSVQFGLGSGQRDSISYVDYLQTSILNDGGVINFVPEPASLTLMGLGAVALLARRRNR